ncbi:MULTISPECIES: hypothetical protein [unclassified Rhizobium]|uniref:hypothetical protein n=1 Tax=unclassified Rhizobium TaxID=2613769 RepID=UPI0011A496E0|nr:MULTISPECIES: hypothetical protein [unclassified Rhizobium]
MNIETFMAGAEITISLSPTASNPVLKQNHLHPMEHYKVRIEKPGMSAEEIYSRPVQDRPAQPSREEIIAAFARRCLSVRKTDFPTYFRIKHFQSEQLARRCYNQDLALRSKLFPVIGLDNWDNFLDFGLKQ